MVPAHATAGGAQVRLIESLGSNRRRLWHNSAFREGDIECTRLQLGAAVTKTALYLPGPGYGFGLGFATRLTAGEAASASALRNMVYASVER